ncbi:MAG: RHS repeat-associated core domain-containing protein [Nitrospirae bacterium]|nr:RHS repeat-associated core domain-containing protein [Nitrospirota bacterium]
MNEYHTGRFVSKDPIGFNAGDVNLYRYVGNNPANRTDPEGLEVERCCRNIQVNPVANAVSNFLGLQHCFIKTAIKEAGMGPTNGGPLPAYPVGIKTEITDHTAQSEQSTCKKVSDVDEDCVNRELQIGKATGKWLPGNNCNKFIYDIFFKCRRLNIK